MKFRIIFLFFLFACASGEPAPAEPIETSDTVYVTYGGHIEDLDVYWKDCAYYEERRNKLLDVADLVQRYSVTFNLQVEYDFLRGVLECETEEMQMNTDGENILHYLATRYDFEIDVHQEGAWDWEPDSMDNWADAHYLGTQVTPLISDVTGLVWNYPDQFIQLNAGQQGRLHSGYTWSPMIIGSAVGYNHHLKDFSDDDVSSGVWKPKGTNEDFYVHDDNMRMVYTGSGVHGNWGGTTDCEFASPIDYIEVLQQYQRKGKIDSSLMWTSNIYVPQKVMFENLEQFEEILIGGESLDIEYVTYSELVGIWMNKYQSQPSQLLLSEIDPSDYTC